MRTLNQIPMLALTFLLMAPGASLASARCKNAFKKLAARKYSLIKRAEKYFQNRSRLPCLIQALGHTNKKIRGYAYYIFSLSLKPTPPKALVFPHLRRMYRNKKRKIYKYQVIVLWLYGMAALPELSFLANHPDKNVRRQAVTTMVTDYFRPLNKDIVDILTSKLKDKDKEVRRIAAWGLALAGPIASHTIKTIVGMIKKANQKDGLSLLKSLVNDGQMQGFGPKLVNPLLPFLEHENKDFREVALQGLLKLGKELTFATPSVIPKLVRASYHSRTIEAAYRLLAAAGPKASQALPTVFLKLSLKKRYLPAFSVAIALGAKGKVLLPTLRQVLLDKRFKKKERAIEAIGAIGPAARDAQAFLVPFLASSSVPVKIATIRALGRLKHLHTKTTLAIVRQTDWLQKNRSLREDKREDIVQALIYTIHQAKLQHKKLIKFLQRVIRAQLWRVAHKAALALEQTNKKRTLRILRKRWKRENVKEGSCKAEILLFLSRRGVFLKKPLIAWLSRGTEYQKEIAALAISYFSKRRKILLPFLRRRKHKEKNLSVRLGLIFALSRLDPSYRKTGLSILLKHLKSVSIKMDLLIYMGYFKKNAAYITPRLFRYLWHHSPWVSFRAAGALERLGPLGKKDYRKLRKASFLLPNIRLRARIREILQKMKPVSTKR